MLLIKTKLKQSPIHGFGVFAEEFISKGTKIGQWIEGIDVTIDPDTVHKLNDVAKSAIIHFGYLDNIVHKYKLNADNMRFFNHSNDPNTFQDSDCDYSVKDICAGDEITCNYYIFDLEAQQKLEHSDKKETQN